MATQLRNNSSSCPLELGVGYPWLGVLEWPAPGVQWPAAPEPVHNHGAEDGAGLSCREYPTLSGRLRGACLDQPRERWRYVGRVKFFNAYDIWELVANPAGGRRVGESWACLVPA